MISWFLAKYWIKNRIKFLDAPSEVSEQKHSFLTFKTVMYQNNASYTF